MKTKRRSGKRSKRDDSRTLPQHADQSICLVSGLVGLAIGWICIGANRALVAEGLPSGVGLASCLCALAVGVRLPHRLAMVVGRLVSRFAPNSAGVLASDSRENGRFLWMLLSLSALTAGVGVAVMTVALGWSADLYRLVRGLFFWPAPTDALLAEFVASFSIGLPLVLIGFAAACANRLAQRGSVAIPVVSCLVLGGAAGVAPAHFVASAGIPPHVGILLCTLPLLTAAVLAGRRAGAVGDVLSRSSESRIESCRTEQPVVRTAATVGMLATAVCSVGWIHLLVAAESTAVPIAGACLAIAFAVGMALARRIDMPPNSVWLVVLMIGSIGIPVAVLGVLAVRSESAAAMPIAAVVTLCHAFAVGCLQCVLERASGRPHILSARFLSDVLWWPGVTVAVFWVIPYGSFAVQILPVLASLMMCASGATLPLRGRSRLAGTV